MEKYTEKNTKETLELAKEYLKKAEDLLTGRAAKVEKFLVDAKQFIDFDGTSTLEETVRTLNQKAFCISEIIKYMPKK